MIKNLKKKTKIETMKQNNPEEEQPGAEHTWSQPHVSTWLQDGMVYTIILNDNTRITDAVFHYCALLGKHYFTKGANVYPIEKVQSHSLVGHEITLPPDATTQKQVSLDPDRLAITDDYDTSIQVITTPDTNPVIFRRRVKCQMLSGLSQEEAERVISTTPMELELFYEIGLGGFAVDAEAVGNTPLYSPYTGKEIPDETT